MLWRRRCRERERSREREEQSDPIASTGTVDDLESKAAVEKLYAKAKAAWKKKQEAKGVKKVAEQLAEMQKKKAAHQQKER